MFSNDNFCPLLDLPPKLQFSKGPDSVIQLGAQVSRATAAGNKVFSLLNLLG